MPTRPAKEPLTNQLFGLIQIGYSNLRDNFDKLGYYDLISGTEGSRSHASLTKHNLVPYSDLMMLRETFYDKEQNYKARLESVISFFKRGVERHFLSLNDTLAMYEQAMSLVLQSQNDVLNFLSSKGDYAISKAQAISSLSGRFISYSKNDVLMGNPRYSEYLSKLVSTISMMHQQPNINKKQKLAIKALLRFNELYLDLLSGNRQDQKLQTPQVEQLGIQDLITKLNALPLEKKGFFAKPVNFNQDQLAALSNEFYEQTVTRSQTGQKDLYCYCALPNTMFSLVRSIAHDLQEGDSQATDLFNLYNEIVLLNSDEEEDLRNLKKRKKFHINRAAKYLNQDDVFKTYLADYVVEVGLKAKETV